MDMSYDDVATTGMGLGLNWFICVMGWFVGLIMGLPSIPWAQEHSVGDALDQI
jgi:hypothetical protein